MADQGQMFEQDKPDNGGQGSMFEVGGRQYDAEAAAKKIENADMFIETLKSEKSQMESQYKEKLETLEAQLASLSSKLDAEDSASRKIEELLRSKAGAPQEEPKPAEKTTPPAVDEDAIIRKLREQMETESKASVRAANMSKAMKRASEVYGNEWQNKLREIGSSMSMDEHAIQKLAETSPDAFAQLFGLKPQGGKDPAPSQGSSVGGAPKSPEEPPKSVMFGTSTKDLIDSWRYSGQQVGKELGFEYSPEIHKLPKSR